MYVQAEYSLQFVLITDISYTFTLSLFTLQPIPYSPGVSVGGQVWWGRVEGRSKCWEASQYTVATEASVGGTGNRNIVGWSRLD